ncbi:bifunctional UDP-N-acetylglucosamine diphosphorylase/glucosamine-1-phosphate N-acetyltransferase GlmU [Nitrospirillum sp. BR 11828]|uniref:bifunctional UDP-N-acetylglucosamine diphosphorylase/glucosamine-1-phosphate N-acetyltransferase GlmU n=1 Tax=Nitrospirillum sp. BR 11828 TaxID=3104325 RepID=UPI002ACAAD71|nr:bifunctional UDP-N-acetylglucosamine diphosphorylase/glucosamine-1-phosphate N-acetyltransferase GlmU [Nitrospirillum sp. BR 11828]MDZ5648554.1 bifunctional UDP-N-acetylglucosamine diphosphorylase/glucosamine-1-phosphate N-acetyltransferase GlmU [Nitrospirillum sp. BR 11828]
MTASTPTATLACIVLAAGKGTRMKSDLPKVLHPIANEPMVAHVLRAAAALNPDRVVVVVGPGQETVAKAVAPHATVLQPEQLGTADAVKAARAALGDFDGDVLVLFGDTPLVRPETLSLLVQARRGAGDPAVAVLGMRPADPAAYGRLVQDEAGGLTKIVEYLDATVEERAIGLCNAGLMAFDGRRLWAILDAIGNANAKGEYYLTDAVAVARAQGHACAVAEGDPADVEGVNSRVELAKLEKLMQARLRRQAMLNGATLADPDTVWFSADTVLGRDVTVGQNVVFGPGVVVEDGVTIRPFCHLEGVVVRREAIIGPYSRLRPGSDIGAGAHIGNFVEVKASTLGQGAKANHLAYVGDADIGEGTNIGAGAITCNYDGTFKYRTQVGRNVFVGTNATLVAPVQVGDGAFIAGGSTITETVPADALAIGRGRQVVKEGWAAAFAAAQKARKAAQKKG